MPIPPRDPLPPGPFRPGAAEFSDAVWLDVLSAVDRTYADLIDYQERLERQNAELEDMRRFLGSILSSVSDVLIVVDRGGAVEEISASLPARTGNAAGADLGARRDRAVRRRPTARRWRRAMARVTRMTRAR